MSQNNENFEETMEDVVVNRTLYKKEENFNQVAEPPKSIMDLSISIIQILPWSIGKINSL